MTVTRPPFTPTNTFIVISHFTFAGKSYKPGDVFPWATLNVDQRRLRQMYDHRRIDPAATSADLAAAKTKATKLGRTAKPLPKSIQAAQAYAADQAAKTAATERTAEMVAAEAKRPEITPADGVREAIEEDVRPDLPNTGLIDATVQATGGGWYGVTIPGPDSYLDETVRKRGRKEVEEFLAENNARANGFGDDKLPEVVGKEDHSVAIGLMKGAA